VDEDRRVREGEADALLVAKELLARSVQLEGSEAVHDDAAHGGRDDYRVDQRLAGVCG
jgi:hypothetical protein